MSTGRNIPRPQGGRDKSLIRNVYVPRIRELLMSTQPNVRRPLGLGLCIREVISQNLIKLQTFIVSIEWFVLDETSRIIHFKFFEYPRICMIKSNEETFRWLKHGFMLERGDIVMIKLMNVYSRRGR